MSEYPGVGGDGGEMSGLLAEEMVDRGIDEASIRTNARQQRIELAVEAVEQLGIEHILDDHGAVLAERLAELVGRCIGRNPRERGGHGGPPR